MSNGSGGKLSKQPMPVVIRRIVNNRFENHGEVAGDNWDLRTQIEALEEWMNVNGRNLDRTHEWVADVGFISRPNATGGGPPLTKKLMRACLDANLEIYLSEYGGVFDLNAE